MFLKSDELIVENGIGAEGAKVISEMLKVNHTIEWLNLGCEEEEKERK